LLRRASFESREIRDAPKRFPPFLTRAASGIAFAYKKSGNR